MPNKQSRTLVLSSTSPERQRLLRQLQLPFEIFAPAIDETPLANESITALVQRLAEQKALAACQHYPQARIIGADTVGCLHGQLLNKPITHKNAVQQLTIMSGQCVTFYTGLSLYDAATAEMQSIVENYQVYFRPMTATMITDYLEREKPYYCSGSIKAEGLAVTLIERFAGDDVTIMLGLPLLRLVNFLEKSGVSVIGNP